MILKTLIDNLNSVDRRTLEYAAEHNIAQFIKIGEDKYIGVYAERIPQLKREQNVGIWSYGTTKG